MKKLEFKISYLEYDSADELNETERVLLMKAQNAVNNAYAPYSKFNVGAAVLLKNGEVVIGSNQENVAFPSGLCAERVAIYAAGAHFPDSAIEAIAISCKTELFEVNEPLSPCGACRQAIAEYELRHKSSIKIILSGATGTIRVFESIADLLPFNFKAKGLLKGV